jgi:hypothetical protein
MKRQRFKGAFGGVEQTELQLLKEMVAKNRVRHKGQVATATVLLVFYTLRVRARAGGVVVDGAASLGRWSGLSRWPVQRALDWLHQCNVITWGPRSALPTSGDGPATGWGRVIKIQPSSEWRTGRSAPNSVGENGAQPITRTGRSALENGARPSVQSKRNPDVHPEGEKEPVSTRPPVDERSHDLQGGPPRGDCTCGHDALVHRGRRDSRVLAGERPHGECVEPGCGCTAFAFGHGAEEILRRRTVGA